MWPALLLLLTAPLPPPGFVSEPKVPSGLLLVANRSPRELAAILADNGVAAGFELMRQDSESVHSSVDIDRGQYVAISDLAAAFNRSHAEYQAVVVDGVLVVRPSFKRLSLLDLPSLTTTPVVVAGLMSALRTILSGQSRPVSGGIGGSGPPPLTQCLEDDVMPITLDGTSHSHLELLNDVARQSSHVWYVISDATSNEPKPVAFGLLHRGGRFTQSAMP